MQIKSIVAAAAIALIAGVGSVSADELSVADTAGDTGTLFALLDGIATEQMTDHELAATRGAATGQLNTIWGYGYTEPNDGFSGEHQLHDVIVIVDFPQSRI